MPLPAAALAGMFMRAGAGAWQAGAAWDLAERFAGATLPQLQHACTVVVRGGPQADLRRVWYLCASAAFGRMKKSPALNLGSAALKATWDVSGKAAQIELVYQRSTLGSLGGAVVGAGGGVSLTTFDIVAGAIVPGSILAGPIARWVCGVPAGAGVGGAVGDRTVGGLSTKNDPVALIQIGPDQITVGGGWPDFLRKSGQFDAHVPGSGADPVLGVTLRDQVRAVANTFRLIETAPRDQFPRNLLREWPVGGKAGAEFRATFMPHRLVVLANAGVASTAGSFGDVSRSPTLPDDGRIITTGEKTHPAVQPPRPLIDGSTRTSLVALVAATLHAPCVLPEAMPITNVPLYSRGVFVHDSGLNNSYDDVADTVNRSRNLYSPTGVDEDPAVPSDRFPDNTDGLPTSTHDFRG